MSNNIEAFSTLAPTINTANNRNKQADSVTIVRPDPTAKVAVRPLPLGQPDKQEQQSEEISTEELYNAVKKGNELFQAEQRNLQINVDDETKQVVVKVVDRATGEVIRQMPTKEVLDFVKYMQQQTDGKSGLIKSRV